MSCVAGIAVGTEEAGVAPVKAAGGEDTGAVCAVGAVTVVLTVAAAAAAAARTAPRLRRKSAAFGGSLANTSSRAASTCNAFDELHQVNDDVDHET